MKHYYYLWLWNETHSKETNVTRFNLGAVNHSGCNILWGGSITQHSLHLAKHTQIIYQKTQKHSSACASQNWNIDHTLSPSLA